MCTERGEIHVATDTVPMENPSTGRVEPSVTGTETSNRGRLRAPLTCKHDGIDIIGCVAMGG